MVLTETVKGCLLEFDQISIADSPEVETYYCLSVKQSYIKFVKRLFLVRINPLHPNSVKSLGASPNH